MYKKLTIIYLLVQSSFALTQPTWVDSAMKLEWLLIGTHPVLEASQRCKDLGYEIPTFPAGDEFLYPRLLMNHALKRVLVSPLAKELETSRPSVTSDAVAAIVMDDQQELQALITENELFLKKYGYLPALCSVYEPGPYWANRCIHEPNLKQLFEVIARTKTVLHQLKTPKLHYTDISFNLNNKQITKRVFLPADSGGNLADDKANVLCVKKIEGE